MDNIEHMDNSNNEPLKEEKNLDKSPKILEYIDRVKKGETIESFGEIPESWKKEIKDGLEEPDYIITVEKLDTDEVSQEKEIEFLKNKISEKIGKAERLIDLEDLKDKLIEISGDYYFLTHQTNKNIAKKINKEGFLFQAGGLNTTMLFQGAEGIIQSLTKMHEGESHRGSDGMIIIVVPKEDFNVHNIGRFDPDKFADYLLDTDFEKVTESGEMRIPIEYNLGVYSKDEGFIVNPKYI